MVTCRSSRYPTTDLAAFRRFSSQLITNGAASQAQIARAFGVPLVTVKRACQKLRQAGAAGFFRPPAPRGWACCPTP